MNERLGTAFPATPDFIFQASIKTVWPSGLRRWLQAPVRKGVGSNPTAVMLAQIHSMQLNLAPAKSDAGNNKQYLRK